jgi:catechol-2,3-dioxygenase
VWGGGAGGAGGPPPGPGLYHLAWEVDTLAELERLAGTLQAVGALAGASDHGTTKSVYGRDVEGLEFELTWVVPADQLTDDALEARQPIGPLDLAAEQRRYGAHTRGGVGISTPAAS